MPLHDFECKNCNTTFEQVHSHNETVFCEFCNIPAKIIPIGHLADYTGISSMTFQYATKDIEINKTRDSFITKTPSDHHFLRNPPITKYVDK